MPKRGNRRVQIRAQLKEAGLRLVDFEPRVGNVSRFRPDVLGYASNLDGDLVPWAVVEVKEGKTNPAAALPSLLKARELFGTVDHYCVINGDWYRADATLRSLTPVDGPTAPPHGSGGFIADESLATSLMVDRLWFEAEKARTVGGRSDDFIPPYDLFADTAMPGIETATGEFVAVLPKVLQYARRRALAEFTTRGRRDGEYTSAPVIADAVAFLVRQKLGGIVLDPFCGTGNFLWAIMDHASQLANQTQFVGQDINEKVAGLARVVSSTAPLPTTITVGDSLTSDLPLADVIIAAPPLGLRLLEPYVLEDGSTTRDLEIAAIDRSLQYLRAGGRAVFLLSADITFKASAEAYRQFLANEFRIGALVGLPAGAIAYAGFRTVLLVIDREKPGTTFVAQLGEDWQTQFSAGGAALNAALQHLDDYYFAGE